LFRAVENGRIFANCVVNFLDAIMQFYFACPLTVINVLVSLVYWLYRPLKTIKVCCQLSALLSVLTVLANSTFEGMFYFLKPQRWSIFPTEKEKYAVLAVSLPTF